MCILHVFIQGPLDLPRFPAQVTGVGSRMNSQVYVKANLMRELFRTKVTREDVFAGMNL